MARVPKITPASDLREDVADVLRRAQESREPQVIIQGDERPAVVMSVRESERVEYERQVLRALARGEQEITAGAGYDMSSVFEEADALLNADGPDGQ